MDQGREFRCPVNCLSGAPDHRLTTIEMLGILAVEVFATMVFCKEAGKRLRTARTSFIQSPPRVSVFDQRSRRWRPSEQRILEIAFKGDRYGGFWVPPAIYRELRDSTFHRFSNSSLSGTRPRQ